MRATVHGYSFRAMLGDIGVSPGRRWLWVKRTEPSGANSATPARSMSRTSTTLASAASMVASTSAGLKLANAEGRSEEHTSELQSQFQLVCRLLLEKKNKDRTR